MTDKPTQTDPLDQYFADARQNTPQPSTDLLARIVEDAVSTQKSSEGELRYTVDDTPRGVLASLLRQLGGWPTLAGLSTASVAGLWLGLSAPELLVAATQGVMQADEAVYAIEFEVESYFDFSEGAL